MSLGYLSTQVLNGLSFGALLFLLASGFTQVGALARPGSTLRWILDTREDDAARLQALYRIAYARPPTAEELDADLAALAESDKERTYEDLWFSMITSSEMVTNH